MANITFSVGSGVNDSIYGKSQAPIASFIEKRGEAFEQKSLIPSLFKVEKSTHYGEKLTSMTAMEGFKPVGENGAHPTDGFQEGYSQFVEHMTWKDSFSISREMVEDSVLLNLKGRPQAFVTGYYRTREKFMAQMYGSAAALNASFKINGMTFSTKAADGQKLFYGAHPAKVKGGAQSNCFSNAFSLDALSMAETAMQNFKDDNGNLLDVAPDTIVIPNTAAMKKAVFQAIGSTDYPLSTTTASDASDAAVFNYQFGRWKVIICPYINAYISGSPWLLLDSRYMDDYNGAVWFDRTPLDVNSYIDNGNDANVWNGFARWGAVFNDWRFAALGGASTSGSSGTDYTTLS